MPCTDIDNFLQTEADRISSQTTQKPWMGSAWEGNDIVAKTAWPDGMGESIDFITYERSMPLTNNITFDTVSFNDGGNGDGSGSCSPTTVTVYAASTRRTMTLKKGAVESSPFCIEDVRMSWNSSQQLSQVLRNINGVVKHAWQNARRDEFTSMCSNKAIADSSMTTSSSTFATGGTIGTLTQDMLDYWWLQLTNDGAHEGIGIPMEYDRPVLPLVLSAEAQKTLVRNSVTADNIRWSHQADKNLAPMGAFSSLDGFKHKIDIQAARWNLTGGAWVRVPFLLPATSAGQKASVNPDYYTAEYEDLVIATPHVVKFAIPGASLKLSSGVTFQPTDYMGNFKWVNIQTPSGGCNPDGNIGNFRGVLGFGAQPGIPEYGVVLRFRRCPASWTIGQCS
jgi:hypothetical protein